MSIYPEILSSEYRIIDGKKHLVRKFGLGDTVLEEELTPIPDVITSKRMNLDGSEIIGSLVTKPLKKE